MYFVMQRAALTLHLTTRMPVLWICVGMCGTGIGVVFGRHPSTLSKLQIFHSHNTRLLALRYSVFKLLMANSPTHSFFK